MFYFFARDKQDGLLTRYPNLKRDEVSEILKCFWRTNMQIMRWKYCITFYVFYNKQEDRAPLTQTQKVLLLMEICFPSEPFPLCMRLMAEASKRIPHLQIKIPILPSGACDILALGTYMAALKACLKSLDEEQRAELDYYNALNNLSDIEKDQVCYNVVLEKARERMLVIQDITEKSSLCMHELKERLRVTHASADQSAILLEHFREMSGSLLNIRKFHNTLIGAIRGMIQAKKLSKVTLTSDVQIRQ